MASQRPIRFGILGAAKIAPSALIEPAAKLSEVEVVAIAARDPARAREFAKAHRIARVHKTYEDLIADSDIDVIYNPLPNSMHCEWSGAIGKLTYAEGHFSVPIPSNNIRFDWNLAGGATMDLGCYPLHMIRAFSGLTPHVVAARAQVGPPNIDVKMEADLELAPGVIARMTCSMTADAQIAAYFLARGEHGELRATNPIGPHRGHQLTVTTRDGTTSETVPGETTFIHQLRAFVATMRGDRSAFPTDARDGSIGMRVIDDVYRAAGLHPRASK